MRRRPTGRGRLNPTEPKSSKIRGRNKGVDHANRIVICNPVVQASRQKSRLPAISPLNEARHASALRFNAGIIAGTAFSHSQGHNPTSGDSGVTSAKGQQRPSRWQRLLREKPPESDLTTRSIGAQYYALFRMLLIHSEFNFGASYGGDNSSRSSVPSTACSADTDGNRGRGCPGRPDRCQDWIGGAFRGRAEERR